MAVSKNFVVKNGIEVNENLIVADSITNRVGVGSTTPNATLDVKGKVASNTAYYHRSVYCWIIWNSI